MTTNINPNVEAFTIDEIKEVFTIKESNSLLHVFTIENGKEHYYCCDQMLFKKGIILLINPIENVLVSTDNEISNNTM